MILIAGLGNPGKHYEKTRHNFGFAVLDALASELKGRMDGFICGEAQADFAAGPESAQPVTLPVVLMPSNWYVRCSAAACEVTHRPMYTGPVITTSCVPTMVHMVPSADT